MIYTSTSALGVTLIDKVNIASYSVASCKELGLTGRVLVIPEKAINILEGPEAIVKAYVAAIKADPLIGIVEIHEQRHITELEFEDYAVWMSYKPDVQMRGVYHLTAESFQQALPDTVSVKTRLVVTENFSLKKVAA
jgi:predicted sulfurtransferase